MVSKLSAMLYGAGICQYFFEGQNSRVVNASRLCEVLTIKMRGIEYQVAHLVPNRSPYSTLRWFQSRPRFYMASASADILFEGPNSRVVNASRLCEVLTIKLRGIEYQVAHLLPRRSPYSTSRLFQSRPRFYMAPESAGICLGVG
jgi:hypothetical protein